MTATLEDLQKTISSLLEAETVAPVPGSEDWELRRNLINSAQNDWARARDWDVLYKEINTRVSQSTGNATISMPSNFRKLAGYPKIVKDGVTTYEYPVIDPQTRSQYNDEEKFVYVLGSEADGFNMIVHPPSLISGASIFYSYYATPSSLATQTDTVACPDPNYLVYATLTRLLGLDEDGRADLMRLEAERILLKMEEQQNIKGQGFWDRVKTSEEVRHTFRWGRD